MKRSLMLLSAVLGLLVAGCSTRHDAAPGGPPAVKASPHLAAAANPIANGRLIYQTGRDAGGAQIGAAQQPPLRPSCAACHRANGSGGVHLPGGAISADLRYKALVTGQKKPYAQALLERAISTGIDNNGQTLNPVMPRWKLTRRDLHDVALYVRAQLK